VPVPTFRLTSRFTVAPGAPAALEIAREDVSFVARATKAVIKPMKTTALHAHGITLFFPVI
jgi:hypothetical protein